MKTFLVRRFLYMILMLVLVSITGFFIINLPPGDFMTSYIAQLQATGTEVDETEAANLRKNYGLDRPIYVQYFIWVSGMLRGDFGWSFDFEQPVSDLIGERIALTIFISMMTLFFTYVVAVPIGVFSAVKQYSIADYIVTFFGFLGLATPNFLLALLLMYFGFQVFGADVGGLFSTEFVNAPWSFAKIVDMFRHLWVPVIVLGTAGTAGIIRVMRATLLDELPKQYVVTARAKGAREIDLILRYPTRVALNPIISTIGWMLPQIISGAAIVSVVLSLPTTGQLLLRALRTQDMYLAGSMIILLSFLTILGTLLSDILLAVVDPRIRMES